MAKPVRKLEPRQEAESTIELEGLKKRITSLEAVRENLLKDVAETKALLSQKTKECFELKSSLKIAQEKIVELEKALNQNPTEDGHKDDYLEVVAIPPKGVKPIDKHINGMLIPKTIDKYGFYHWKLPKENACKLLVSTGMKHVLVGPVDFVICNKLVGSYMTTVKILKHAIWEKSSGGVEWVPVEVEESK